MKFVEECKELLKRARVFDSYLSKPQAYLASSGTAVAPPRWETAGAACGRGLARRPVNRARARGRRQAGQRTQDGQREVDRPGRCSVVKGSPAELVGGFNPRSRICVTDGSALLK